MKWYNQAIFYHMYPLGMLKVPKVRADAPTTHKIRDLKAWLPHLQRLGVSALYIGPLFESTSHGYDTLDYYRVDARLGDNFDFTSFVDSCHEHNIKVVVDGVFNHTGKEFFAFLDLLEKREASPYKEWYKDVNFSHPSPSGEPFSFQAWRGVYELANLNLNNPSVRAYLLDVVRYWITTFHIDGIRLDCADCLSFDFMKELRRVCDDEKDDFWLMGELIHGDYSRWIGTDLLHSSTNYELHKGLYSSHNDHNYFEIAHSITRQFNEESGIYKGLTLYSFVDNHDVNRIASTLHKKEHLPLVYTLMYTLPGIPSIYYGSEWGIEGCKEGASDDALRPALCIEQWQEKDNEPLPLLLQHLGALKKEYPLLSQGRYKQLFLQNTHFAFIRYEQTQAILVVLNNDDNPITFSFDVCGFSQCEKLLIGVCEYSYHAGYATFTLAANTAAIALLKR